MMRTVRVETREGLEGRFYAFLSRSEVKAWYALVMNKIW